MGCSPLYFMNLISTRHLGHLILKSLYPISGPCSFSKIIACCISYRRNGTRSFSLISLVTFLLKSNVTLYPAAHCGLFSSSMYIIFWASGFPTRLLPWAFLFCKLVFSLLLPLLVETFYLYSPCPWPHLVLHLFAYPAILCDEWTGITNQQAEMINWT